MKMKSFIAFAALCLAGASAWVVPPVVGPGPDNTPIYNEPIDHGPIDVQVISVNEPSPIAVGPEIIDFPLPDGGAVTAEEPAVVPSPAVVAPSPVVIGEIPAGSSPLVQIIVNVNQASAELSPIAVGPAIVDQIVEEAHVPGPVNVVDNVYAPDVILEPIQVVEPIVPGPVNVVDNVVVEPIQVVEPVVPGPVNVVDNVVVEPIQVVAPIVVEPVIVGTPIVPVPAVVIPDILN